MAAILILIASTGGLSAPASVRALSAERGLELVTPELPGPAVTNVEHISPNGEALVYQSLGAFPGSEAGDLYSYNLAVRGPSRWENTPINPPYVASQAALIPTRPVAFDEGLATSLWQSLLPLTANGPEAGRFAFYRRPPNGLLDMEVALGKKEPTSIGASADGEHLVFGYPDHLLASDAARTSGLGIYELAGSSLRQVDVAANGEELSACGADDNGPISVSRSGERIVFSALSATCGQPLKVYVREGGRETLEVSKSQCTRVDCNAQQAVFFVGATPSVSSVFMVTSQQLTNGDVNDRPDLYRRDLAGGKLELLTGAAGGDGEVLAETIFASEDGSRIFFYARGRLASDGGSSANTNLYLFEDGRLRLVAPLDPDQPLAVTPDGRYALLSTQISLSQTPPPGVTVEGTDTDSHTDVYRYDAVLNRLTLLSAGPSGGNGSFDATSRSPLEGPQFPGAEGTGGEIVLRAMSDDGQRAWFSTGEGLTPDDSNEADDLYEWHSGALSLISDGRAKGEVAFAGASPDGRTVLFRTTRTLLSRDRDGGDRDVYAARIGGGFDESRPSSGCAQQPCQRFPMTAGLADSLATAHRRRPARGRLMVGRLASDIVAEIIHSGRTRIEVRVPVPGIVSAKAVSGKTLLAKGVAGATRTGRTPVVLEWMAQARAMLAVGRTLKLQLRVRESTDRVTRRLTLKGANRR